MRIEPFDTSGQDAELAPRLGLGQPPARLRRDTVPMQVPERPGMSQEPPALDVREMGPERLGVGPQAVEGVPPASTFMLGGRCARADPGHEPRQPGAERYVLRRHGERRAGAVRLRQESMTRHGGDRTAVPVVQQPQHTVHHGQTGADHDYGGLARDPARTGIAPAFVAPGLGRQARPLVAGRHDGGIAADHRGIAARDCHAVRHGLDPERLGLYASKSAAAEKGIDQVREVVPI